MSASIKVEFDDGRMHCWNVDDDEGISVVANMIVRAGDPAASRVPLHFERLEGIDSCYTAETSEHTYVIIVRDHGDDVRLYQMPGDQPFCPVNANRANRFRRFDVDYGDNWPLLGSAMLAAQQWDDEANGLVNA